MKKCLYCAEEIRDEAIKCRYCKSELEKVPGDIDHSYGRIVKRKQKKNSKLQRWLIIYAFFLLTLMLIIVLNMVFDPDYFTPSTKTKSYTPATSQY